MSMYWTMIVSKLYNHDSLQTINDQLMGYWRIVKMEIDFALKQRKIQIKLILVILITSEYILREKIFYTPLPPPFYIFLSNHSPPYSSLRPLPPLHLIFSCQPPYPFKWNSPHVALIAQWHKMISVLVDPHQKY